VNVKPNAFTPSQSQSNFHFKSSNASATFQASTSVVLKTIVVNDLSFKT